MLFNTFWQTAFYDADPFFSDRNIFYVRLFLRPLFQGRNEDVKQGLGVYQGNSSPNDCDLFLALRLRNLKMIASW